MYFYTDLQIKNQSLSQINTILKTKEVISSETQQKSSYKVNSRFLMDFKNIWKE